jgi:DNA-binding XRE family transcriptional regulator
MNHNQYRTALERLGLTQDSAAEFLGVSLRTSHGYANGSPIPKPTAMLLRLMTQRSIKPEEIR